jgi:hypothetical protein
VAVLGLLPQVAASTAGKPTGRVNMTLEDWSSIAQIVGVILVVVTLSYLAIQVRQGAQLLRSESR